MIKIKIRNRLGANRSSEGDRISVGEDGHGITGGIRRSLIRFCELFLFQGSIFDTFLQRQYSVYLLCAPKLFTTL